MEPAVLTTAEFIGISLFFLTLMIGPGIIAILSNHPKKYLIAIASLLTGWTVFAAIYFFTLVITHALKETKINKWAEKNKKNIYRAGGAFAVIVIIFSIIEIMNR